MKKNDDLLAAHDEAELIDFSQVDPTGGTTTIPCIETVIISYKLCPSTKCTSQC